MVQEKATSVKSAGHVHNDPEIQEISRTLKPGWYEVPPTARGIWQNRCAEASRNIDTCIGDRMVALVAKAEPSDNKAYLPPRHSFLKTDALIPAH